MVEVSAKAGPLQLAQMKQIAAPNDMVGLYFPADFVASGQGGNQGIPDDLVILAVPKSNPNVPAAQFHLLKDALRPLFKQSKSMIFEDNNRWIGSTKTHIKNGVPYVFTTSVISIQDRALMVQYLRKSRKANDQKLVEATVGYISEYILAGQKAAPAAVPLQTAPKRPTSPSGGSSLYLKK